MDDIHNRIKTCVGTRADAFETYAVRTSTLTLEVKDGRLETLKQAETRGVCVRTIRRKRLGFSYSFRLDTPSLRAMADNALRACQGTHPDPAYAFPDGDGTLPALRIFDHSIGQIPKEKKLALAGRLESFARSYSKKVARVRRSTYSEVCAEVFLANSLGLSRRSRYTIFSIGVMAVAEDNGDSQMGWESDFSHSFIALDPAATGRAAARKAVSSLGARRIGSLSCPVVLDREVVADILPILSSSFTSESVFKKKSSLAGKIGTRIFSPCISMTDNGLSEKGAACFPFDGEGIRRRRTALVGDGRLLRFLYDTFYARKMHMTSTGHCSRGGVKSLPSVGPSNLSIEAGHVGPEDLIREARSGVYITELIGVHTADPISGDFSLGATGHRIEGGRLTYPVGGMAVAGNLFDLMKGVRRVGNDHRYYGPWGAPSLLLERVSVSGR